MTDDINPTDTERELKKQVTELRRQVRELKARISEMSDPATPEESNWLDEASDMTSSAATAVGSGAEFVSTSVRENPFAFSTAFALATAALGVGFLIRGRSRDSW